MHLSHVRNHLKRMPLPYVSSEILTALTDVTPGGTGLDNA